MSELRGPARIMTICTGNICRSPYGERVFQMYFDVEDVLVTSAGTGAVVGSDMVDDVRALLPAQADSTPHVAAALEPAHLEDSDIVFTMTRTHRSDAVKQLPRSVKKVFTLREAARLIMATPELETPSDPVDGFKNLAEHLQPLRGLHPQTDGDDVADPYKLGQDAYRRMKHEMDPALAVIVRYVTGQLDRPTR